MMSYTKEVPCAHCEGTGEVTDYDATDIRLGSNIVPGHTKKVECPICLGQGHVRVNPREEPPHE